MDDATIQQVHGSRRQTSTANFTANTSPQTTSCEHLRVHGVAPHANGRAGFAGLGHQGRGEFRVFNVGVNFFNQGFRHVVFVKFFHVVQQRLGVIEQLLFRGKKVIVDLFAHWVVGVFHSVGFDFKHDGTGFHG